MNITESPLNIPTVFKNNKLSMVLILGFEILQYIYQLTDRCTQYPLLYRYYLIATIEGKNLQEKYNRSFRGKPETGGTQSNEPDELL